MEPFFSRFPDFKYDPKPKAGSEFNRLQELRGWTSMSPVYKEMKKQFSDTLRKEDDALEEYFAHYPNFYYDSKASPKSEFQRLSRSQYWGEKGQEYFTNKRMFNCAFDRQFQTAVNRFFRLYPGFDYNPRAEAKAEFERLRDFNGWFGSTYEPHQKLKKQPKYWKYRDARKEFFKAFVKDFSGFFGEGNAIHDWEFLCDVLKVPRTPSSIDGCKSALRDYYVNIYDLYDHVRTGSDLLYHHDLTTLSHYSIEHNLLYPLHEAKTTCMKFLLRDLVMIPGLRYDDWSRSLVPDEDD